jgi:anthranilate/para-aminobenzoate synthase component I
MLVDLERNDLGRVARYGTVSVDEFMALEDYSHVKHIVSNVRGVLKPGLDAIDALKSFFPGGTITGTPKVRSMEIINELEGMARGAYTGSLGYLGYNGNMDFNILIRSFVIKSGMAHVQVGAGIVSDSDPKKEHDETLHKAKALFSAVFGEKNAGKLCRRLGLAA